MSKSGTIDRWMTEEEVRSRFRQAMELLKETERERNEAIARLDRLKQMVQDA